LVLVAAELNCEERQTKLEELVVVTDHKNGVLYVADKVLEE
jgi:hypothetical protein